MGEWQREISSLALSYSLSEVGDFDVKWKKVWCKTITAYDHKHPNLSVNHGGSRFMLLRSCSAKSLGRFAERENYAKHAAKAT